MRSLGQAAITLDMAPPLLLVEMISPRADNHRRDYIDTRNQLKGAAFQRIGLSIPNELK